MNFVKRPSLKGVCITPGTLKISKLPDNEKLELHTLDHALVLLKGQMTAPELLAAAHTLAGLAADLITHLSEVCGPCEQCGENSCPYDDLDEAGIDLPDYLRQEAGIPQDAKLCAEVNEENSSVTISAAEHRHDLRDIPPELLATFTAAGACLGELEEHMIMEDIIYGK